MDIKDIIKILENEKLRNLFTEQEQMDMYLLVQNEVREYLKKKANKTQQNGNEDISSFTLRWKSSKFI